MRRWSGGPLVLHSRHTTTRTSGTPTRRFELCRCSVSALRCDLCIRRRTGGGVLTDIVLRRRMDAAVKAVVATTKMKRAGGSEAVRVVVRCRPLSSKEVRCNQNRERVPRERERDPHTCTRRPPAPPTNRQPRDRACFSGSGTMATTNAGAGCRPSHLCMAREHTHREYPLHAFRSARTASASSKWTSRRARYGDVCATHHPPCNSQCLRVVV